MTFFAKPLAGIALALAASFANAATTTFDFTSVAPGSFSSTINDGAFTLSSIVPKGLIGTAAKLDPVKGNETLTSFGLTMTGTNPFDLESLELTDLLNTKFGGSVLLTYTVAGSKTIHSDLLSLDKKTGFETFSQTGKGSDKLPVLDDLTSFSLVSLGGFQVDDIKVEPFAPTPAVPEPQNAALLLAGVALLGSVARRRKL
jgi:hypothetical protein